jgi:outer membrane receptor protein involved in Fe transport
MIHIFAEVSGLPAGSLGHVLDAEAGIRFVPVPFLTIGGGYRYLDVKIEHDNDSGALKLSGPFAAVSVRF